MFQAPSLPSGWINTDFPSFVMSLPSPLKLRGANGQPIPLGTPFFLETWTHAPFYMEGLWVMFRLNTATECEFVGYQPFLQSHLNEQMTSPQKIENYWKWFWSNNKSWDCLIEGQNDFEKAFVRPI